RGLDPLDTHLVVADESRTEKTICLAVTPSLKACGVPGRPRLFEAIQKVDEINALRLSRAPGRKFSGSSFKASELKADPSLKLDFIKAPPRMASYMAVSSRIYEIYLKYVCPQDIHVYSIDEVFIDATPYLQHMRLSPREFAMLLIKDVLENTGITATAGIGTNMYLCKVAMDIVAKHIEADENGVRIAELDEMSYRRLLWDHQPITDFWRIGHGYAKKLQSVGLFTMGDVARCSVGKPGDYYCEGLLYRLFGVNAELLIDHAWGWESCSIADVKSFKPRTHSLCSGQVLQCPYDYHKAEIIVREMTELLVMDMLDKGLVSDGFTLTIGYDRESLSTPGIDYRGPVTWDHYGRAVPQHAHGTARLESPCCSVSLITAAMAKLYKSIVNPSLLIRRINIAAENLLSEEAVDMSKKDIQLDMFTDYEALEAREAALKTERSKQLAILRIRKKFGKNAILTGLNFQEGATTRQRNAQVGGHRA
ncbi:MAG: DNA methylase, partial [Oscillospiraceae bacterium]|nr:DNA methylase [Oscillospiraceae bacterium]